MKILIFFFFLLFLFGGLNAQTSKVNAPVSKKLSTSPKVAVTPSVPKDTLPSINIDQYASYPNEDRAIQAIDSLYPNTVILSIDNLKNVLRNKQFKLVGHLIKQFDVKPTIDYLYYINSLDFICGVGLKRSTTVSPACLQPKVYESNKDSEAKVKLASLILSKGIRADYLSVSRCISKNELELFKLLYLDLVKVNNNTIDGEKLLVEACDYGTYDIFKFLLDHNISPNAYDHMVEQQDFKVYAIFKAVKYPEIFFLLVEKGADVFIKGYQNHNAMIPAANLGCIEVLKYLLEKGIDPFEKQGNSSAFDIAKQYNNKNKEEVLALFQQYKPK